jgi:hypothetical protein
MNGAPRLFHRLLPTGLLLAGAVGLGACVHHQIAVQDACATVAQRGAPALAKLGVSPERAKEVAQQKCP